VLSSSEGQTLDELNRKLEQIAAQLDELRDEYGGEESLLTEVIENDKIGKPAVQKRIKEIGEDAKSDELSILQKCAALFDEEAQTKRGVKDVEKDLEARVLAKYPALSLEEIKKFVVERKWMDALATGATGEVDRLSLALTGRVKELVLRYAEPMPIIEESVERASAKVAAHLEKMGFAW